MVHQYLATFRPNSIQGYRRDVPLEKRDYTERVFSSLGGVSCPENVCGFTQLSLGPYYLAGPRYYHLFHLHGLLTEFPGANHAPPLLLFILVPFLPFLPLLLHPLIFVASYTKEQERPSVQG